MSLFQEFDYVDPDVSVKIVNIFTSSFYGSCLWDIFSNDCEKLYKSWNVSIREAFNVDRCTHRYLIETMSNSLHPKIMLASRYVTFHKSLITSSKLSVRVMARLVETDQRTVMGRTLDSLCSQLNISDINLLTSTGVKTKLKYFETPSEEEWRSSMVTELIKLRNQSLSLPGFTQDEINAMLVFTCTT
jgi:hypothetical protein